MTRTKLIVISGLALADLLVGRDASANAWLGELSADELATVEDAAHALMVCALREKAERPGV